MTEVSRELACGATAALESVLEMTMAPAVVILPV